MNKQEFINNPDVKVFIVFLANQWKDKFDFKLGIKEKGKTPKYKKIGAIKEAFENYFWEYSVKTTLNVPKEIQLKGSSLEKSEQVLEYCKSKLKIGGKLNPLEQEIREASEIILKWGGVFIKGNKDKVEDRNFDIVRTYQNVLNEWEQINQNQKAFYSEMPLSFPSNAGFTKIYSLLLDDYIIYDSRVSVALAYLLETCFNNKIPDSLNLFIPSSKIVEQEKRKVSPFFKSTHQKDSRHFYSNVKTSLLLSEVVDLIRKEDSEINIRQIEAALFMIGYDIRN